MDLWKQEPALKGLPSPAAAFGWKPAGWVATLADPARRIRQMYFSGKLHQTLGYLNQPYGPPATKPNQPGDPQYPFPWLNWSYRPFNNEYELLLVPAVSSSRLLARNTFDPRRYYNYVDQATRTANNSGTPKKSTYQTVYDPTTVAQGSSQRPYPHLLNFFESTQSSKSGAGFAAQLHRLFGYVGVPSRFANVQLQIRPDEAALTTGAAHYFHTPFNRISRYREPGRINLNTLTSSTCCSGP